jgi:hypothetical protein
MNLKGKNLRVLVFDSTASKFKVIGMSTSCALNQVVNTESGDTKDDVGLAAKPVSVSKGWSVDVESLNVVDVGAMLTAVKSMTPMKLMFDEVDAADNQTPEGAALQRVGTAYLSDFTATFNDRENSVKKLQFQGTGELTHDTASIASETISAGSYTKGQFVRLFLSNDNTVAPTTVIAAARQLQLHVSLSLENSTTKDTTGDWICQEPTSLSYDITTGALVRSGETITSSVGAKSFSDLETIKDSGNPVKWEIANVSGANNRTKGASIVSGSAIITQLNVNSPLTDADYTATLAGYGNYTVAAA